MFVSSGASKQTGDFSYLSSRNETVNFHKQTVFSAKETGRADVNRCSCLFFGNIAICFSCQSTAQTCFANAAFFFFF